MRENTIIDLIFTNSPRRRDITIVRNVRLSNHNSIQLHIVTDKVATDKGQEDKIINTTNIPRYNYRKLDQQGWKKSTHNTEEP